MRLVIPAPVVMRLCPSDQGAVTLSGNGLEENASYPRQRSDRL